MEICRRIAMGQWSLSIFVRPESNFVYRPVLWMLPAWTNTTPLTEDIVSSSSRGFMNDSTQISSLIDIDANRVNFKPVEDSFQPQNLTQPEPRKPENSFSQNAFTLDLDDKSEAFAAKQDVAQKVEQISAQKVEQASVQKDAPTLSLQLNAPGRARSDVQNPHMASEGSVSLVDESSATQVKFKRVNPTVPRRRKRSPTGHLLDGLRRMSFMPKKKKSSPIRAEGLLLSVSALVILAIIIAGVITFKRRTASYLPEPVDVPSVEVSTPLPMRSDPGEKRANGQRRMKFEELNDESKIVTQNSKAQGLEPVKTKMQGTEKQTAEKAPAGKKNKKSLSAKSMPALKNDFANEVPKKLPARVFAQVDDLKAYLSSSGPDDRGFVVVGPLTVLESPPGNCSPCRGRARLRDGSTIALSSFMRKPWSNVSKGQAVFVKGVIMGDSDLRIIVNSISSQPPR